MDIYGELGKFMRDINDYQDQLWKSMTEQSLKLCRYEYEMQAMEKEKEENLNNGATYEHKMQKKYHQIEK